MLELNVLNGSIITRRIKMLGHDVQPIDTHTNNTDTSNTTPTGTEQIIYQADNIFLQLADMKVMTDAQYDALKTQIGGPAGTHGERQWTEATAQALLDALNPILLSAQKPNALDDGLKFRVECDDLFKQINAITPFLEADYYALADSVRGGTGVPWTLETSKNLRDQMQIKLSVAQNNQNKPYVPGSSSTHTTPDGSAPATPIVKITDVPAYVMPDNIKQLIMQADDIFKKINAVIAVSDVKNPYTENEYYAFGDSVRGGPGVIWTVDTATKLRDGMQAKLDSLNKSTQLDFTQEGDNGVVTIAGNKFKVPMIIIGGGIVAVLLWLALKDKK